MRKILAPAVAPCALVCKKPRKSRAQPNSSSSSTRSRMVAFPPNKSVSQKTKGTSDIMRKKTSVPATVVARCAENARHAARPHCHPRTKMFSFPSLFIFLIVRQKFQFKQSVFTLIRRTFSAAHLAFSADLWYAEHGTQLNHFGNADTMRHFVSLFSVYRKSCVPTIGDTLCRACLRLGTLFSSLQKIHFRCSQEPY